MRASVILPTYNESGNIVKLVEKIRHSLALAKISHEVILVDDNSPDQTGLLAQKYFSKVPEVRVIIRKKEKGLATAIRHGIEMAVGDVIVVMDTDFNHEPELVPQLVTQCDHYDMAIGSRFVRGGGMANKTRETLSYLFNILVRLILQSPVHDNLIGFFACRMTALEKVDFNKIFFGYGDYFIRLIYLVKKQGGSFTELPSLYQERTYGSSKSQFLVMFRDYLATTIKLRLDKS